MLTVSLFQPTTALVSSDFSQNTCSMEMSKEGGEGKV